MAWHMLHPQPIVPHWYKGGGGTCPALLSTQTLAGAVNNPLGNLPSPKCLTEAGHPRKGGPTPWERGGRQGAGALHKGLTYQLHDAQTKLP